MWSHVMGLPTLKMEADRVRLPSNAACLSVCTGLWLLAAQTVSPCEMRMPDNVYIWVAAAVLAALQVQGVTGQMNRPVRRKRLGPCVPRASHRV